MTLPPGPSDPEIRAYERGRRDARIDNHDKNLTDLRTDLTILGNAITDIAKATQRLGDQAKASAEATIALAKGLKEERDTARDTLAYQASQSEGRWSKSNTLVAGFGTVASIIGGWYVATH